MKRTDRSANLHGAHLRSVQLLELVQCANAAGQRLEAVLRDVQNPQVDQGRDGVGEARQVVAREPKLGDGRLAQHRHGERLKRGESWSASPIFGLRQVNHTFGVANAFSND